MRFFFSFFFFVSLFSVGVGAVGVTPARYDLHFAPGYEGDFPFTILNNAGRDMNFGVKLEGALTEYASVNENTIFAPEGGRGDFSVHLDLPEVIDSPGKNIIKIAIVGTASGNGNIRTRVGVIPWIVVDVPYPGRYADISSFHVGGEDRGVNEGVPIPVSFELRNWGSESLSGVRAVVTVVDVDGSVLLERSFDDISIPSETIHKESFSFPNELLPSDYIANLTLFYDDVVRKKEQIVRIGSFNINLLDYPHEVYVGEGIVEFKVSAQSRWDGVVFAEGALLIPNLDTSFSPRLQMEPFKSKKFKFYVDSSKLSVGEQEAILRFTVMKEDALTEEENLVKDVPISFSVIERPVEVVEEAPARFSFSLNPMYVVFIVLVLLLLVNMMFIYKAFIKGHKGKRK